MGSSERIELASPKAIYMLNNDKHQTKTALSRRRQEIGIFYHTLSVGPEVWGLLSQVMFWPSLYFGEDSFGNAKNLGQF